MIIGNAISQFKFTPSATAAVTRVFDVYGSNVIQGYSVARLLDSTYTGDLIEVVRGGDSLAADIGVDGSGNLDEAALLAHVNGGDGSGYVSTIYSQKSGGINLAQTTAANRPRIATGGVVDKSNGKPAMYFDGTNDYLISATPINGGTKPSDYSQFSVFQNEFTLLTKYLFSSSGGATRQSWGATKQDATSNRIRHEYGDETDWRHSETTTPPTTQSQQGILQITYQSGDTFPNVYVDGGSALTMQTVSGVATSCSGTEYNFAMGIDGQRLFGYYEGYQSELLLYADENVANREGIRDNINSYYGTF